MSRQSYLVTGATGFVGSNLVRTLITKGNKVSIICRNKNLNWRLRDISSKLDIHVTDLRDLRLTQTVSKIKPSIIFHLATYGASVVEKNVDEMVDTNIKGTLNLINALGRTGYRLFVNTGSSSEYGIKNAPMRESDNPEPLIDYAVTKTAVTLFCQKIARTEGLPIITLRLFSPYGYFQSKEWFIPNVISNMLEHKPLILSSPDNARDFIFIDDVIDAYRKTVGKKFPLGTVINIGSGKDHHLQDIVSAVARYTHSKSKITWRGDMARGRQIEPKVWQADIMLAKKLLGWNPTHSLDSGLQKTIKWIKENRYE